MRRRALPSWERNAEGLTKDRTPSPETTKSSENQRFALVLAHKSASWRLCDVGGDAPGLVASEQAGSRSTVRSLCVVRDVRSRSAPAVMTALAVVVHHRECAAARERDRRKNYQ